MIVKAEALLERYEGPRWIVRPSRKIASVEGLAALNADSYELVIEDLLGWDDYMALIRSSEGTDYLVRWDDVTARASYTALGGLPVGLFKNPYFDEGE